MRFVELFRMAWCRRWRRPFFLLIFLALPCFLSLLLGVVEGANQEERLTLGLVDEAQNAASHALLSALEAGPLTVRRYERLEEAELALAQETLDQVLVLPEGFDPRDEDQALALYLEETAGDASFAQAISLALMPQVLEGEMRDKLALLAEKKGEDPATWLQAFDKAKQQGQRGQHLQLQPSHRPAGEGRIFQLPPFRMELLWLSLFALLAMQAEPPRQQLVMLARHRGPSWNWALARSLSLLLLGGLSILSLLVGQWLFMQVEGRILSGRFLIFFAFLLLMLLMAELLRFFHAERRMTALLLLLSVSAIAGGSFFPMPSFWLKAFGQYTPHGWALLHLQGLAQGQPWGVLGASFLSLAIVTGIHRHRTLKTGR